MIRLLRIRDNNQMHRAVVMYFHIGKSNVANESSTGEDFCVSMRRSDEVTFIVTATYGKDSHVVLCESIRYPARHKKGPHASPSKKSTTSDETGAERKEYNKEYNTAKRVVAEPFLGGLNLMLDWGSPDPTSPTRDSDIEEDDAPKKRDPSITILIAKCYINTCKLDQVLSNAEGFHAKSAVSEIQDVNEVLLDSLHMYHPYMESIEDVTSSMSITQDVQKQPFAKRRQPEKAQLPDEK